MLAALFGALLAGCAGSKAGYTKDSFSGDSPYQSKVPVPASGACAGARRALLGDGYIVDRADAESVKGRKAYPTEGDRSTFIEMTVVCMNDAEGSTLYSSGLVSTYEVKKAAGAASVGVSAIGSVSLPIGQSADSMVKVSEETITDRGFYARFFRAVDGVLGLPQRTPPEQKR